MVLYYTMIMYLTKHLNHNLENLISLCHCNLKFENNIIPIVGIFVSMVSIMPILKLNW